MKLPPLLTPADVAGLLGITTKTLRKQERFWGLVRVPMATRTVRYEREAALKALWERGLISAAVRSGSQCSPVSGR